MSGGKTSSYDGYRQAVSEISRDCPDVVFLESAYAGGNGKSETPGAYQTGLAEQDIVLIASGMALSGKRVFVSAPVSPLLVARSYEQIRATVATPNLKVVLSSVRDGEMLARDGAARQMNEDFALMRVLPNMAVISPCDSRSAYALTHALASHNGPAYIRLSHSPVQEVYAADDSDFHIGGGRLLTEGDGVTICATGTMVEEAVKASSILTQQGISAEIVDCYSVKPFPEQMLLASVRRTGCCVVAEKHTNVAGLYGAVAECLCRSYTVPVRSVAIEDDFGQSGTPEELQEYYGLTYREIVHNVVQVWAMRRR